MSYTGSSMMLGEYDAKRTEGKARTACRECGGILAETDGGRVWCLSCEPWPADAGGLAAGGEWTYYRQALEEYEARRYDVRPAPRRRVLPYV